MIKKIDHTIIIRTRNRSEWLSRALSHYVNLNHKGRIHIEDDSTDEYFERNKSLIKSYENVIDVRHFRGYGFKEKTRSKRVLVTTINSLKNVETEYYSFSSDDDFLLPSFLNPAINFLEKNKEHSCVIGPEVKIHYDNDMNITRMQSKPWHGCEYTDPLDRIFDYTYNPTLAYYGVCRTNMRDHLTQVEEKTGRVCFGREGVVDFALYDEELPWVMLVYSAGKIHYMPNTLMSIRGIHESADRIERLHKSKALMAYSLGPIFTLSDPTAWKGIRESHEDLCMLIHLFGTKYDKEIVDDSVMRIFWDLLIRFSGSGLYSPDTDYCLEMRNRKSYSFISSITGKIKRHSKRKFAVFITSLSIMFSSDLRAFSKNHNKVMR